MGGNRPEGGLVKKVRLVMGALGAAVPAVGMMVPPVIASAAVQHPGKSVKTAGFFHQAAPAAPAGGVIGPGSSSAPLPGSATFSGMTVHSGTPCTGIHPVSSSAAWAGTGMLRYKGGFSTFYQTNAADTWLCVGTVTGKLTKTAPNMSIASGWMRVRLRVGANSTLVRTQWAHFNSGTGVRHPSVGVKQWHRINTQVCVRYFWGPNSNSPVGGKNEPAICWN
jgi:hypothetical protein